MFDLLLTLYLHNLFEKFTLAYTIFNVGEPR